MLQKRREIILLTGMHRCGTSALARLLNLCGAEIPGALLPASAHNPRGYWETAEVVAINIRALQSAGLEWNAMFEVKADWYETLAGRAFLADARRFAASCEGYDRILLIKDPRISLLAAGWRQAFEAAGFQVKFVIAYRDPREVALSLATRQLIYVPHEAWPPERSYAIWLNYLLAVERASRDSTRSFVDYGLVLADWRREFTRIRSDLGLEDRLSEVLVEEEIDTFLTKDLRNARAMGPYNESGVVSETLKLLHAGLHQPDELHARFDAVYATFSEARQMFGDLVVELQRKNEALAGHTLRAVPRAVSWRSPSADSPPGETDEDLRARHQALLEAYSQVVSAATQDREGATSVIQKLEAERDALEDVGMRLRALEIEFADQVREAEAQRDVLESRLAAQTTDSELERDLLEQRLADKTRTSEVDQDFLEARLRACEEDAVGDAERAAAMVRTLQTEHLFQATSFAIATSQLREEMVSTQLSVRRAWQEGWHKDRAALLAEHHATREAMAQEREALVQELDTERAILRVSSEALGKTRRELSEVHRALDACAGEVTEARSAAESAQSETAAELERILRSKSWRLTRPLRGLRRRLGAHVI